jgi:hypothetical protein
VRADRGEEFLGRTDGGDDLEALAGQQLGDALAEQHAVVGDHDALAKAGLS